MKELSSAIEIDASPERVWNVLTDFSSYARTERGFGAMNEVLRRRVEAG